MNLIELKYKLRKKIPKNVFIAFYAAWRRLKFARFYFYRLLSIPLLFIPNMILKSAKRYLLIFNGWGIGDLLSLTSVIPYLQKKGDVEVVSSNKSPFMNLGVKITDPKEFGFFRFLLPVINASMYSNIIGAFELPVNMNRKKRHLREALLSRRGDFCDALRKVPHEVRIVFSEDEISAFSKKYKSLIKKEYGIIISGSYVGGLAQVKNWGKDNFQKIIDMTKKKIKWVQVGIKVEPSLEGTYMDLKGTTSIRELFFLVSKAKIIVASEGLLTHASSAFGTPCISIYSGYHYPEISKYDNVIPVISDPMPPCANCWISPCKLYDSPLCLRNISVSAVASKFFQVMRRSGKSL